MLFIQVVVQQYNKFMRFKGLSLDKIKSYGKYFSPEKFWEKMKKYAKVMGREMVYYILVLYYMMTSSKTPLLNKAIIVGALGYLIFPLDFIPDAIPIVGYTDDFAAIMAVFNKVKDSITPEIEEKAKKKLSEWFPSDKEGFSEVASDKEGLQNDIKES